jgi:hypothetical protein
MIEDCVVIVVVVGDIDAAADVSVGYQVDAFLFLDLLALFVKLNLDIIIYTLPVCDSLETDC